MKEGYRRQGRGRQDRRETGDRRQGKRETGDRETRKEGDRRQGRRGTGKEGDRRQGRRETGKEGRNGKERRWIGALQGDECSCGLSLEDATKPFDSIRRRKSSLETDAWTSCQSRSHSEAALGWRTEDARRVVISDLPMRVRSKHEAARQIGRTKRRAGRGGREGAEAHGVNDGRRTRGEGGGRGELRVLQ